MWISRTTYTDLRESYIKANEEAKVLASQIRAYETTQDWFRVRITQLEHERAALVQNYMGVTLPVPSIERAPEPNKESPYHPVPHFNDVGDAEAKKLGITWNPDGSVSYPSDRETA